MQFIERLLELANMWAEANNRSLACLATIVANDGKLFDRLNGGGTCTVATLERVFEYLATPANWPADELPEAAKVLFATALMERKAFHAAASTGPVSDPSPDIAVQNIPDMERAA